MRNLDTALKRIGLSPVRDFGRPRRLGSLVGGGAILVALVAFAYMASALDHFPGEVAAASWVQSWRTSWLDTAMKAISPDHRLVTAPLVVVVALALFLKGMRTEGGLIVAATMVSFVTLIILKAAIARPRPPPQNWCE